MVCNPMSRVLLIAALLAAAALVCFPPWVVRMGPLTVAHGHAFLFGETPALGLAKVDAGRLALLLLIPAALAAVAFALDRRR